MGALLLASSPTPKTSGTSYLPFLIIIVLFGLFYMLVLRPQRNRQRNAAQTQNKATPGQRVRTSAGLYGTIVSADDRDVILEIAPGVQVTMLRRAITDVIPEDDPAGGAATGFTMPASANGSHPDEDSESAGPAGPSSEWDVKDKNI